MRNLALTVFLLTLIFSCKNRDEAAENLDVSALKTDSVKLVSDTVSVGNSLIITTYSTLSGGCESFYKYSYTGDGLSKNITANRLKNSAACGRNTVANAQFTFSPKSAGRYTLRFWTGKSAGSDVWIEKKLLVR